jgi:hypothetical protein
MCSLRFENNFLTIEGVRFASIFEENTIIEAFVRFRFASIAITSPNLWFWGGHTRLRERGWGCPNSDEGTYTIVL